MNISSWMYIGLVLLCSRETGKNRASLPEPMALDIDTDINGLSSHHFQANA